MKNEWARERLDRLVKAAIAHDFEPEKAHRETAINVGGVSLTVSGSGMVLVIAPGLNPGDDGGMTEAK